MQGGLDKNPTPPNVARAITDGAPARRCERRAGADLDKEMQSMPKANRKAITHIPAAVTHGRLTPTSYEYVGTDVKVTLTDENGDVIAYTMCFSDIVKSVTDPAFQFKHREGRAARSVRHRIIRAVRGPPLSAAGRFAYRCALTFA